MKTAKVIAAAILAVFMLQGCGKSGTDDAASQADSTVTVKSGTGGDAASPSSARLLFALSSIVVPAQAVSGVRFTFTIPQGQEPVLVPNPDQPDADTVEIDPARITLPTVSSGAVVVASFKKSTRKVEVALIDTDGLSSSGSVLGSIAFDLSNPGRELSAALARDLVLEEVISTEGQLPVGAFILSATAAQ